MEKKTFIFNSEWDDTISLCNDTAQLEIYRAIVRYNKCGDVPEFTENEARIVFSMIKKEIDYNNERYSDKIAKLAANGRKGGRMKGINSRAEKIAKIAIAENCGNFAENEISDESATDKNEQKDTEKIAKIAIAKNTHETSNSNGSQGVASGAEDDEKLQKIAIADNMLMYNVNESSYDDNNARARTAAADGAGGYDLDNLMDDFFSKQIAVEGLCASLHTDTAELRLLAEDCIAEWKLRDKKHPDYEQAARHLINHIRVKLTAPKPKADREEQGRELLYTAARRMSTVAPCDDPDTQLY